jgi:hypothetical protein
MAELSASLSKLTPSSIFNRKNLRRAAKNILRAVVYIIVFLLISRFVFPLIPSAIQGQSMGAIVENFITIFFILSVLSALTSGTILQVPLSFAKALVPLVFTVLALETPMLTIGLAQTTASSPLTLSIDTESLLIVLLLLDLVLLAKEVLQLISFAIKRVT